MIFEHQRGWICLLLRVLVNALPFGSAPLSEAVVVGAVLPREAVRGRWRGKRQDSIQSFQFGSGAQSCLFRTPWTVARQASLSICKSVL